MPTPLPGMNPWDGQTPMEEAAREHLDRLKAEGRLTQEHQIMEASIMALAHSMGHSAAKGQSVGLAQASKEMREWWALLPAPPLPADDFTELMSRLAQPAVS